MSAGVQVADQAVSGDESVAAALPRRRSLDPRNLPVYSHSPGDEGQTPEIELPVANARLLEADSGVGPFDILHPYKPQDDVPWWYR